MLFLTAVELRDLTVAVGVPVAAFTIVNARADGEYVGAVALQLGATDTGNGEQLGLARRPSLGECDQRQVGEYDVSGHARVLRLLGPPLAQPLEERLVVGRRACLATPELAGGSAVEGLAADTAN